MEVGYICIKIAGRDAGKPCVIVEKVDDQYVVIAGETRRRKCNIKHLEPTGKTLKIVSKASMADVIAEFKKENITVRETKKKEAAPRQKKVRKQHNKVKPQKKKAKKVVKKEPKEAVKKEPKEVVKNAPKEKPNKEPTK